jgi:hypothetical protein
VIRVIVGRLTGAEARIDLGSIQILQSNCAKQWRVEQLDFTAHLDPDTSPYPRRGRASKSERG